LRTVIATALLALLLSSCGQGAQDKTQAAGKSELSFARDVQPLFDTNCVQCHLKEAPQGGLNLEDGSSHAMLVGVRSSEGPLNRVTAGAPEKSYLMNKLEGTHLSVGGQGAGMPLVEGMYHPLSPKDIEVIRSWIADGAPLN
jgi:mono/diheme cytochrome c family protein